MFKFWSNLYRELRYKDEVVRPVSSGNDFGYELHELVGQVYDAIGSRQGFLPFLTQFQVLLGCHGAFIAIGRVGGTELVGSWTVNTPERLVEHYLERSDLSLGARREWLTSSGGNEIATSVAPLNGDYVSLFGVQFVGNRSVCSHEELGVFGTFLPHVHRAVALHARLSEQPAPPAINAGLIQEMFGLTDAEAEVASQLVAGKSMTDIAKRSGRSRETVKSHLKSLFRKTDTRRQGALVSLLSRR